MELPLIPSPLQEWNIIMVILKLAWLQSGTWVRFDMEENIETFDDSLQKKTKSYSDIFPF